GGEAAPAALLRELDRRAPELRVLNHYGPTEATLGATGYEMPGPGLGGPGSGALPLGRPLPGAQVHVADPGLEPAPRGVAGELVIGGGGVARGYLGRPAATAERFVPDPFGGPPGARLYRTGDRGRLGPAGALEFLGRLDDQVKVRGFRVEPGEVRAALEGHPEVREAAVVPAERGGSPRLVAYAVPRVPGAVTGEALRDHLSRKLPEVMVPWAVVLLDALPLTPNGKVDRRRLPDPADAAGGASRVPPRTPLEATLCRIWSEVLGVPEVGVLDGFFELGGDSILMIQVVARAHKEGIRLEPRQLFEHHTVAALARVAAAGGGDSADPGPVLGPVPPTPVQRWFFELDLPDPSHWNQAVLLEVEPRIGAATLARAVARLLEHHDALRLRFAPSGAGWTAQVAPPGGPAPVVVLDHEELPPDRRATAVEEASDALQRSLDLTLGPLFRAALFDLGQEEPRRLLLVAHHLVVDGVSWGILLGDLATLAQEIEGGARPRLPPRTTSFQAWAERLAERVTGPGRAESLERETEPWLSRLEGAEPALPAELPAAAGPDDEGSRRSVAVTLGREETETLLRRVPRALDCQPDELLLAAVAEAVRGRTGERSVLIELEGHGREPLAPDDDLSRTVGWFAARFPVRIDLPPAEDDLPGAVRSVQEALRAVPQGGVGFGLLRYVADAPEVRARAGRLPRPRLAFNYLGRLDAALPPGGRL
ncbi:MAG TPA: condensation domain-containing protein, partial [Thermoanaerobaculia bacterium]|nr:condensation domain-containing protein [Thermoanaerobaculia bacterium]